MTQRLRVAAGFRVPRFSGIHHFGPPDQLYIPAHAEALQDLGQRDELKARQAVAGVKGA